MWETELVVRLWNMTKLEASLCECEMLKLDKGGTARETHLAICDVEVQSTVTSHDLPWWSRHMIFDKCLIL